MVLAEFGAVISWLSLAGSLAGILKTLIGWMRHAAIKREGHNEAELDAHRNAAERRKEREAADVEARGLDRVSAVERLRQFNKRRGHS